MGLIDRKVLIVDGDGNPTGEDNPQPVQAGGYAKKPSGTLTRPANMTAYTAEDEVATNGTSALAISVARVNGGTGFIVGGRLIYSSNPTVTPQFRAILFNDAVTLAGDNTPLALSDADAAKFIGYIDFTASQPGGSASSSNLMIGGAPIAPIAFETQSGVATIYVALITKIGFTPIANSETIQISLDTDRD